MFSRRSNQTTDKFYVNIVLCVFLTTLLVGFSSADLTDFYLRELRRRTSSEDSDSDMCDGAILKGGHCGLERDNCCAPLQCGHFNMFRRRFTACPSMTKSNHHCQCVYLRAYGKRGYASDNWGQDQTWQDDGSIYY